MRPIICGLTDSMSIETGSRGMPSRNGFTLLEILIAMFLLTIVASLVFASFDGIFGSSEAVTQGSDTLEMGNACLDRISRDMKALHVAQAPRYTPPDIDDKPHMHRFEAEEQSEGGETFTRVRFASQAHLAFNQSALEGIAEIVYYIQYDRELGYVLRRSDKLYPYPDFEENSADPVLCEQVRGFEMIFYDDKGTDHKAWNSESSNFDYATPRSVAIKLIVGTETDSFTLSTEIALPIYRNEPVKK
jgi:general secretion pathway protein J